MKCYYHNDADGKCAGAIFKKTIDESVITGPLDFIAMQYKDEVRVEDIEPNEYIYILDFSFKPEVMNKILQITKNVVWIDHHKTAFEYEKRYVQNVLGIRQPDKSACELTWEYFYKDDPPYAVSLIGDFDTWKFKLAKSMEFKYGLESWDHKPESDIWKNLLDEDWEWDGMMDSGEAIIRFRDNICKDFRSFGYETRFEGWLAFVQNLYMFGSLAFGELMMDYPICISFVFDGYNYTVGLYSSDEDIDVSEIAKKYGGGGHKGAAGFVCKELPFRIKKDA